MKKMGTILLGIVVVVAILIALLFFATSGLPKAADEFFSLVREGKVGEAYLATAAEFRAATGEEEFSAFLRDSALGQYASASWPTRAIENNRGRLEGTVTTRDGGQIPVELDLVKEGGAWKILNLRKAAAGLAQGGASTVEIPPDAELQRMTSEAIGLLAEAINKNDFSGFRAHISQLWQSQVTEEQLREAFKEFAEKQIDLAPLKSQTPVFSQKPAVDENGALNLRGYYATTPDQVRFELSFIYEHPQWKLSSIGLHL
ncbi:MAG TPA: hypothetical protein P5567_06525 [Kiritimatiellia bacterium]|nr:hypothetical protein [Kiritimatiellia bacterium]HRZ12092.1 hypothetical protein [Kiritimatiellia bacterium]HSA18150.1 hypothetical protein [Kiritimatiellia bacterium]